MAKDRGTNQYHPVSERFAKRKIAHAFRDRRRKDVRKGAHEVASSNHYSSPSASENEEKKDSKLPANEMPEEESNQDEVSQQTSRHATQNELQQGHQQEVRGESIPVQQQVASAATKGSPSSDSSLFSDQDLLSVLGSPSEYNSEEKPD